MNHPPPPETTGTQRLNEFGQPIGPELPDWSVRALPPKTIIEGRYCDVVPLEPSLHAESLYDAVCEDKEGRFWTYMFSGPFNSFAEFRAWITEKAATDDPLYFAVVDKQNQQAIGMASYMRMDPVFGAIEVGNIYFSPRLQKTPLATEAMYLMMKRVFDDLAYRRYEWKCDSCNAPSMKAAKRFGFSFEGIFRQAVIYKGRSRDTAWFSIIDSEWPRQKRAFQAWLDPDNFDEKGTQRRALSQCSA